MSRDGKTRTDLVDELIRESERKAREWEELSAKYPPTIVSETEVVLDICQPEGSDFVRKVRAAMEHFGFVVCDNDYLSGSDTGGFFYARSESDLGRYKEAAERLLELDSADTGTDSEREALRLTLAGIPGAGAISQDWSYLGFFNREEGAETLAGHGVLIEIVDDSGRLSGRTPLRLRLRRTGV